MDTVKQSNCNCYRGRFAPTPSGPLHFGSIITALGSYLDAKSKKGTWLVRIDDIDQSRNKLGADKIILEQLEQLGLIWDEPIVYQSQRIDLYEIAFKKLEKLKCIFSCDCSRKEIKGIIYPGTCRDKIHTLNSNQSIRIKTNNIPISIFDRLQGYYSQSIDSEIGDFIIKRADGYFAYHLVAAVDDGEQNITHIVRGFDLLDSTPRQIFLQKKLKYITPTYLHLPIVIDNKGKKISKADKITKSVVSNPRRSLVNALKFLGQSPPTGIIDSDTKTILDWAIDNWSIELLPNKSKIHYSAQLK